MCSVCKNSLIYTLIIWDFPDGPVVKNPPSNAGDSGLIPGWGNCATGQLSLLVTTTEPGGLLSPGIATREKTKHHNEEPAHHNERSRMPQLRHNAAQNK